MKSAKDPVFDYKCMHAVRDLFPVCFMILERKTYFYNQKGTYRISDGFQSLVFNQVIAIAANQQTCCKSSSVLVPVLVVRAAQSRLY
jgi:hypothetical protein